MKIRTTYVFLYYTESDGEDGATAIGNRVYRYEFEEDGSNLYILTIKG